jgi:hypothetical protein
MATATAQLPLYSAMMVFQMIALAAPVWLTKAADKIRRGFLWAQDEVAPGGKCLVNWNAICRPTTLGLVWT